MKHFGKCWFVCIMFGLLVHYHKLVPLKPFHCWLVHHSLCVHVHCIIFSFSPLKKSTFCTAGHLQCTTYLMYMWIKKMNEVKQTPLPVNNNNKPIVQTKSGRCSSLAVFLALKFHAIWTVLHTVVFASHNNFVSVLHTKKRYCTRSKKRRRD